MRVRSLDEIRRVPWGTRLIILPGSRRAVYALAVGHVWSIQV